MEELPRTGIGEKGRLIGIVTILLVIGFSFTSLLTYRTATESARTSIVKHSLPTSADYMYSTLQRSLVEPIFVSSMMANDTFLHDWVAQGEKDVSAVTRYLSEIRNRYSVFTTFYVSDKTLSYYQADGVLKTVKPEEPRDAWYWRVKGMPEPYEINIDPDMAHGDALTIFINYRVIDTNGAFLGAAGVGIAVNSMNAIIESLRTEHDTAAFFVDRKGRILVGAPYGFPGMAASDGGTTLALADDPALRETAAAAIGSNGGSFRYKRNGKARLLFVMPIPELKWFLFVEHTEDDAISHASRALMINLVVFILLVSAIIAMTALTVNRFQSRLERTASYDQLTGALNRMSFSVLCDHAVKESRRTGDPLSIAMFDIDGFKRVNDERGHYAGDLALKLVVAGGRSGLRQSDSLCRWGGEEFIALLTSCDAQGAQVAAEKFRSSAAALCMSEGAGAITLSAGVATLRPDEGFHSLVSRADEALLSAKRAGKDRTVST